MSAKSADTHTTRCQQIEAVPKDFHLRGKTTLAEQRGGANRGVALPAG